MFDLSGRAYDNGFENKKYKTNIYRMRGVCQGIRISLLEQGYSIERLSPFMDWNTPVM